MVTYDLSYNHCYGKIRKEIFIEVILGGGSDEKAESVG